MFSSSNPSSSIHSQTADAILMLPGERSSGLLISQRHTNKRKGVIELLLRVQRANARFSKLLSPTLNGSVYTDHKIVSCGCRLWRRRR